MDNFLLIQLVALVFAVSFGLTASIWGTRHWQMSAIRRRGDQRAVQSSIRKQSVSPETPWVSVSARKCLL